MIQVRIGSNGPFRFLFDTGTSVTVLDQRTAHRIGIDASGATVALSTTGPVAVQKSSLPDIRAGSVVRHNVPILVMDLPPFPSHGRLEGILGADFLAGRSFLIDVSRRCLHLDAAPRAPGTQVDVIPIAGRVALQTDGLTVTLDSAASFPVLMSRAAQSRAVPEGTFALSSAAGSRQARSGRIQKLRVGDVSLRGVMAALTEQTDPREDALLPITLFRSIFVSAERTYAIVE